MYILLFTRIICINFFGIISNNFVEKVAYINKMYYFCNGKSIINQLNNNVMDLGITKIDVNNDGIHTDENGNLVNENGERVDENGNVIVVDDDNNNDDDNEKKNDDDNNNDDNNNNNNDNDNNNHNDNDDNEIKIEEGMTIEVPGDDGVTTYTVDKDLNLVDKDGNVFKKADEVKDFLKSFDVNEEDENELNIANIQKAIGIEITDDNDKPIDFENTLDGVKDYINKVIEVQKEDIAETALNTLVAKCPILPDVINYYIANGNSLKGFNEVPDRTNITLDENNEGQQEEIIRLAWKEQKRTGDVESYIQYLKSSKILYDSAKTELEGLKTADAQRKQETERLAAQKQAEELEAQKKYWQGVNEVIEKRKLGGYTIPETISITRDGNKLNVTPKDFFNYLYRVDKNGYSQYENDLIKAKEENPNAVRDDEILRAYLRFTGGSYADLVKMAINEDKVKTLKLQAKTAKTKTTKVTYKSKEDKSKIDLGV